MCHVGPVEQRVCAEGDQVYNGSLYKSPHPMLTARNLFQLMRKQYE